MTADLLAERRAGLDAWRRDSVGALLEFAQLLGLDPPKILQDPFSGMARVEQFLQNEDLAQRDQEEFMWLFTDVLAYVGAFLICQHGGAWQVDADRSSPTYTRYVIDTGTTRFDPAAIVHAYLGDPPPRSLVMRIAEAEEA